MAVQKTLKISPKTHKIMKILCANQEITAGELVVRALNVYEQSLSSGPVGTGGGNRLTLGPRPQSVIKFTRALNEIRDIALEALNDEESQVAPNAKSKPREPEVTSGTLRNAIKRVEDQERKSPKNPGGIDKEGGIAS